MNAIPLTTLEEINEYCNRIAVFNGTVFYRGTKTNYLLPSIVPKNNKLSTQQLAKIEEELLNEFKLIYTTEILGRDPITIDWLYRIKSREHKLSCRLMDWSHTFYKALDFATSGDFSGNAYVYLWILVIEPKELLFLNDFSKYSFYKLSTTYLLRSGISYNAGKEIATNRQFIQGGNFLVQPTHLITTPINEQQLFLDKLYCIKIPVENAHQIRVDIKTKLHENVDAPLMIENDNCIDLVCTALNKKLLYSVNNQMK